MDLLPHRRTSFRQFTPTPILSPCPIRRKSRRIPKPIQTTIPTTTIPNPFLSPQLHNTMLSDITSQFAPKFNTISQTWIPLCYFMRFCYRENLLQDLLCYLEVNQLLDETQPSADFYNDAKVIFRRFLDPNLQRISVPVNFFPHLSGNTNTLPDYKQDFHHLQYDLAQFLSTYYCRFETSRFYLEMLSDLGQVQLLTVSFPLESNFQIWADLKVKALRQLDSELGIFTHNFEFLPNVDLLYQFRKRLLLVQFPYPPLRPCHKLTVSCSGPLPNPHPTRSKSTTSTSSVLTKLESFIFQSQKGYLPLDS